MTILTKKITGNIFLAFFLCQIATCTYSTMKDTKRRNGVLMFQKEIEQESMSTSS